LPRSLAARHRGLSRLQPDDGRDMAAPVNVPGTSDQYKNWRRKLTAPLEQMFGDEGVNKLIQELDTRGQAAAQKRSY
ncbi:4-alpha-glucanotransferase, partial [Salmonella enterica subsp. enterica serovar Infantis]